MAEMTTNNNIEKQGKIQKPIDSNSRISKLMRNVAVYGVVSVGLMSCSGKADNSKQQERTPYATFDFPNRQINFPDTVVGKKLTATIQYSDSNGLYEYSNIKGEAFLLDTKTREDPGIELKQIAQKITFAPTKPATYLGEMDVKLCSKAPLVLPDGTDIDSDQVCSKFQFKLVGRGISK